MGRASVWRVTVVEPNAVSIDATEETIRRVLDDAGVSVLETHLEMIGPEVDEPGDPIVPPQAWVKNLRTRGGGVAHT